MPLKEDLSQRLYYDSGGKRISGEVIRGAISDFVFEGHPTDDDREKEIRGGIAGEVLGVYKGGKKQRLAGFSALEIDKINDEIVAFIEEIVRDLLDGDREDEYREKLLSSLLSLEEIIDQDDTVAPASTTMDENLT